MDTLLTDAINIKEQLIYFRRSLHERAEIGFTLPKTQEFILNELIKLGYTPSFCGRSIVAELGEKGDVFLLRADTDGLPVSENTGLSFACTNGNMHACGHDFHAAMLLGAAAILKKRAPSLRIRFLFQAAEETLQGAKDAVQAGVLKGVKGAAMLHVLTGVPIPSKTLIVSAPGVSAPASDYFTIEVFGKSAHGGTPKLGVDALSIGAKIVLTISEHARNSIVSFGTFHAGRGANILSEYAKIEGTVRSLTEHAQELAKARISVLCEEVALRYGAKAKITFPSGCPPLFNDERLCKTIFKRAKKVFAPLPVLRSDELGGAKNQMGGSEDFAHIASVVPSITLALCAGEKGKGYEVSLHNAKTDFDESVLPIGAAAYAFCALAYESRFL